MEKFQFDYEQYKKKINHSKPFYFTIIFFIIIILLSLCIFIPQNRIEYDEYYFVEIDNFETYTKAKNTASQLQENDAAGYIFLDNTYHVFASFYSKKSDAKKVANNLKNDYKNCSVFSLNISPFKDKKDLSKKQNSSIKNLLKSTRKIIYLLEQVSLDKAFADTIPNVHKNKILIAKEELDSAKSDFKNSFSNNSKFNLVYDCVDNIQTSVLQCLNNSTISAAFFRFYLCDIVINMHQIVEYF